MAKKIFKYQIETLDNQTIEMPRGAEILHLDLQNNIPCIWALVDDKNPKEKREFLVVGTGHEIDYNIEFNYVGTYQLMSGGLVFHVLEKLTESINKPKDYNDLPWEKQTLK